MEGYNTTYTQNGETRTIVNRKSSPDGEYIDVGLTKNAHRPDTPLRIRTISERMQIMR